MRRWVSEMLKSVKFFVNLSVEYEDDDRAVLFDTGEKLEERTHIILYRECGVANSKWVSREDAYTVLFSLISGDNDESTDTGSNEGQ